MLWFSKYNLLLVIEENRNIVSFASTQILFKMRVLDLIMVQMMSKGRYFSVVGMPSEAQLALLKLAEFQFEHSQKVLSQEFLVLFWYYNQLHSHLCITNKHSYSAIVNLFSNNIVTASKCGLPKK